MKKIFLLAALTIAVCSYSAAQNTPVKSSKKTEEKTTPKQDTTAKKSTSKTTPVKTGEVKLPIPVVPDSDTVNSVPPKSKGYFRRR